MPPSSRQPGRWPRRWRRVGARLRPASEIAWRASPSGREPSARGWRSTSAARWTRPVPAIALARSATRCRRSPASRSRSRTTSRRPICRPATAPRSTRGIAPAPMPPAWPRRATPARIVLGKTVTTEFAYYRPGKTTNPHGASHTPGGSSQGSAAAVGAGMVPLAFGTQTAGSIVRPAAYCGVVGYKPTWGLIPRAGVKVPVGLARYRRRLRRRRRGCLLLRRRAHRAFGAAAGAAGEVLPSRRATRALPGRGGTGSDPAPSTPRWRPCAWPGMPSAICPRRQRCSRSRACSGWSWPTR